MKGKGVPMHKHHTMEMYGSGRKVPCILNLSTGWKWVVSSCSDHFTPVKKFCISKPPTPGGKTITSLIKEMPLPN
jgi:hypothetical protein